METLPVDVLVMMALDMDTIEALRLCQTSTKLNQAICNNPNFWRQKLIRDFNVRFDQRDVKILREYYRLLYRGYLQGYWSDSYLTARANGYSDLLNILKERDLWGLVTDEDEFDIMDMRLDGPLDRNPKKGTLCLFYSAGEIIDMIRHLGEKPKGTDIINLCDQLREILLKKNLIYPYFE